MNSYRNPTEDRVALETRSTERAQIEVMEHESGIATPASSTAVTHVTHGDTVMQRHLRLLRMTQAIYFVFGVLEVLLGIRFLLKLLGANPQAPFSALIYGITEPFIALFRNIFPRADSGVGVLEPESVIAFVVFALLGWGIGQILWLAFSKDSD